MDNKDSFIRSTFDNFNKGSFEYLSHQAYPKNEFMDRTDIANIKDYYDINFPDNYETASVKQMDYPYLNGKMKHLSKEFGTGVHKFWLTENGYSLDTSYELLSPQSYMHAALNAQLYCVMRALPNVEKLMLFCYRYGGNVSGFSVVNPGSARIIASVLGTYNYLLYHAKTGEFVVDRNDLAIIKYDKPEHNEVTFALFRYNGIALFDFRLTPNAKLWNSYGREINDLTNQELGIMPMYIVVPKEEADLMEATLAVENSEEVENQIFYEHFENGLAKFTSSGENSSIYTEDKYAWKEARALELKGPNNGLNMATSQKIDLLNKSKIKIQFWFIGESMESEEQFKLQYFNGEWNDVKRFKFGGVNGYNNNNFYRGDVILDRWQHKEVKDFKFRFFNEGSDNSDKVFIDQVRVLSIETPSTLSINEHILDQKESILTIYPNPSITNYIQLFSNEKGKVSIYNLEGKKVSNTFPLEANEEKIQDIGKLQKGLYLIRFVSVSGKEQTLKYLKN